MALSIQVNSTTSLNPNSVLIPLSSLKEFGFKETNWEDSPLNVQRAILATLKLICATPFVGVLGLTKPLKPSQTTPEPNLINTTYSLTHALQVSLSDRSVGDIPLPDSGVGGLRLSEVFGKPNKSHNLIIPFEDLAGYGYQVGEDNRSFFSAFFQYLTLSEEIPLRDKSTPSGVTAKKLSYPAIREIPDRKVLIEYTYSLTFQQTINFDDTMDLNYVSL